MVLQSGENTTSTAELIVNLAETICTAKHPQYFTPGNPCVLCIAFAANLAPTVLHDQYSRSQSLSRPHIPSEDVLGGIAALQKSEQYRKDLEKRIEIVVLGIVDETKNLSHAEILVKTKEQIKASETEIAHVMFKLIDEGKLHSEEFNFDA